MRLGLKAYETADVLQGPHGFLTEYGENPNLEENPHLGKELPLEANSSMKTSDACMGCHDKRNNSHGVALCDTGDEYVESRSKDTCQSCHMPIVKAGADHSMRGGHSISMLKRAVRLDITTQKQTDSINVKVQIENLLPHNMPTGAPFRNIYLKLTALSANGDVLWQNFKLHPAKEDAQAFFVYVITNDAGVPKPPPLATKVGKNTRLKPYETRVLTYNLPATGVDLVRAELYYNLLTPGLIKMIKKLPEDLKIPKRIAWDEKKIH